MLALPVVVGQLATMLSPSPPPPLLPPMSVSMRHNHHQMQLHRTMVHRPINSTIALSGDGVAFSHFALKVIIQVMGHLFVFTGKMGTENLLINSFREKS